MRNILLLCSLAVLSFSCVTSQPTYIKFKRESDNKTVKCRTVRPDVVTTKVKASIDASIKEIKLINGSTEIDQTVTRIREEIPNLQVLEALTYAACETYGNDGLTPEQYGTYMTEIVPKVKTFASGTTSDSVEKEIGERYGRAIGFILGRLRRYYENNEQKYPSSLKLLGVDDKIEQIGANNIVYSKDENQGFILKIAGKDNRLNTSDDHIYNHETLTITHAEMMKKQNRQSN